MSEKLVLITFKQIAIIRKLCASSGIPPPDFTDMSAKKASYHIQRLIEGRFW